MDSIVVSALYKFVALDQFESLKAPLLDVMKLHQIRGTLLLAQEGINGTVAGSSDAIEALYAWFDTQPGLENISHKESYHASFPFHRTKVKLKKEIVTLGIEGVDPTRSVGTYVNSSDWNQLITEDDVVVIDTRNDYEVQIGSFKGAVNPKTATFREFPAFVEQHLADLKDKKIAMFCTGGIRCEKSTAYLKSLGFNDVYHLQGGILKYLEEMPVEKSLWEGECFVFDERVTVNHALEKGQYSQCYACRYPITEADKAHNDYIPGISCHRCAHERTVHQQQRCLEREKQSQLAEKRGETHIGGDVTGIIANRRLLKQQRRREQSGLSH